MNWIQSALKSCSKKELEEMLEEAKKDKSFGGGYRKSAISRELGRRQSKKRNK